MEVGEDWLRKKVQMDKPLQISPIWLLSKYIAFTAKGLEQSPEQQGVEGYKKGDSDSP